MLKKEGYICKTDLRGAYFQILLDKTCRHLVGFLWEENIYEFLCAYVLTESLKKTNGKHLIQAKPQIVIRTNASLEGSGANCTETGGQLPVEESKLHINILKLLSMKNDILAFTKMRAINAIHIQRDYTPALSYLLRI